MQRIIDFEPSTHIAQLLARPLSEPNATAWLSSTGIPIADTLHRLRAHSPDYARALLNDANECICIWGLGAAPEGMGNLWLITAKEAEPALKTFADDWPEELDRMHELYGVLCAFITASDAVCANWLLSLGFKHWSDDTVTDTAAPRAIYFREVNQCAFLPR